LNEPLFDAKGILEYFPARSTSDALQAQMMPSPLLAATSTPQWEEVQFSLDKGVDVGIARDDITPDDQQSSPKSSPSAVHETRGSSTPNSTSPRDDASLYGSDTSSQPPSPQNSPTNFLPTPQEEDAYANDTSLPPTSPPPLQHPPNHTPTTLIANLTRHTNQSNSPYPPRPRPLQHLQLPRSQPRVRQRR